MTPSSVYDPARARMESLLRRLVASRENARKQARRRWSWLARELDELWTGSLPRRPR